MAARDLVFTVLGVDRASPTFERVARSIDRVATSASRSMALTAATAAASSAAVVTAVGAVPVALAGIGAAAVASSSEVRSAYATLGQDLREGAARDAAPLAQAYVTAAAEIGAAYQDLRPQLRQAFADAVPAVQSLTRGVVGFTRQAMPGLVTMVSRSGPLFAGLERFLLTTGRAVSDFGSIVADSSEDAGRGLDHLGRIVAAVLPAMAGTVAAMTGVWAEHGDQVAAVIERLLAVLGQLSGGALPVVSTALGVILDLLEGALAVVEPLAGALGPLVGAWVSLGTALRIVGAARGAIDGVAGAIGVLRERLAGAGAAGGTASRVLGGVMGLLGGPWGLAVTAAAGALALFGARSEDAAADQRSLASALREAGGVFDSNARLAIVNSEAYREIAGAVERAGLTHGELVDALIEGGPALDALRRRLDEIIRLEYRFDASMGSVVETTTDKGRAAAELLGALDGLRGSVQGAITDFERERSALGGASQAMREAEPGAAELRESLDTLRKRTADLTEHVDALNDAWRRLFGVTLSLEEATASFEESLDSIRESLDGAQREIAGVVDGLVDAHGQIDVTTDKGRDLAEQLRNMGEAYRELAQTAYDTARQQGKSQAEAEAAVRDAVTKRRAQFLAEMQQMGFNAAQAERLADRYLGIPDQVQTLITDPGAAEAIARAQLLRERVLAVPDRRIIITRAEVESAMGALADLGLQVRTLPDGRVEVTANTSPARQAFQQLIRDTSGQVVEVYYRARNSGMVAGLRAHGGPMTSGLPYLVGERGREIVIPRGPATVVPAHQTRQLLAALGRGPTIERHYHLSVYTTESSVDLLAQMRRLELLEGW